MAAPIVEPLALPRSSTVCYDSVGDGEWKCSDHPIARRRSLRQQTVGGSSRMAVGRGTMLVILLFVPDCSFDPIRKCKPCPCTICKGYHHTTQFMASALSPPLTICADQKRIEYRPRRDAIHGVRPVVSHMTRVSINERPAGTACSASALTGAAQRVPCGISETANPYRRFDLCPSCTN